MIKNLAFILYYSPITVEIIITLCILHITYKLSPIRIYPNFYHDRSLIRKDHHKSKGKFSAVYLFINILAPWKMYIGATNNLLGRVNQYLNNAYLKSHKSSNMPFCKALLKYGQVGFCFIIIEYSTFDLVWGLEYIWINILKPYYNVNIGRVFW